MGRLYLPREALHAAGIISNRSGHGAGQSDARRSLRAPSSRWRKPNFAAARAIMARSRAAWCGRRGSWARPIGSFSQLLVARGFAPPRAAVRLPRAKFLLIVLRNLV